MPIPQYSQVANAQSLAAQQTLATQQKQASMFKGGAGFTSPDMGGNNPAAQSLADSLTSQIAKQQSQAINDQRIMGGKRNRTIRRKKRTHRKKRNKRISKRKHYTKRW
jgi:hypothetical protein